MSNSQNPEKKPGCLKTLLTWIAVLFVLAHILSDGQTTKDLFAMSDPNEPTGAASSWNNYHQDGIHLGTKPTLEQGDETHTRPQDTWTDPDPTVEDPVPTVTEPVQRPTTPAITDRYPGVPEDLEDHDILKYRENGACKNMVGNVLLTLVFVNDSQSSWSASEQEAATDVINSAALDLMRQAEDYGASLTFYSISLNASISGTVSINEYEDWADAAMTAMGYDPDTASETLRSQYGVDEAPIIFCVDYPGRSFAHITTGDGTEYTVLFQGADALDHELCHVFGAMDYYVYDLYETTAAHCFTESIMLHGGPVDDLTAYLIGWTKEPTDKALSFLSATADISQDQMDREDEKNTYTGYVTDWALSDGIYTGYLENGWCQDNGRMEYDNGNVYNGMWEAGQHHGTGTFTWADGSQYTGDWVRGQRTGKGTYTWADGTVHVGEFINGIVTGYGKRTWADGSCYEGDWSDGKRHGQGEMIYTKYKYSGAWSDDYWHGIGTITWLDGSRYTGDWVQGERTGKGTYTWANGACYIGEWSNGNRQGQGEMTYANGNKYSGSWSNDKQHGQGTYTWPDGARYTGDFVEGQFHGQGEMTFANGDCYSGGWANGQRHGYGTYTWADGSSRSGWWENGEFVREG